MSVHDLSTTGGRWLPQSESARGFSFGPRLPTSDAAYHGPWVFAQRNSYIRKWRRSDLLPDIRAPKEGAALRQWSTAGRAERAADPTQLGQLGAGVLWSVSSTPLGQEQPGAEGLWLREQL